MTPEEKHLLERVAKLSEENNGILRGIRRTTRLSFVWGVIKIAVFSLPFIIGYFYLEPYFGTIGETLKKAGDTLNSL